MPDLQTTRSMSMSTISDLPKKIKSRRRVKEAPEADKNEESLENNANIDLSID